MTPAERKNWRARIGKLVKIEWTDPECDWPYFKVLKIERNTIKLRGADYPDGYAKHNGDEFWVMDRDIRTVETLEQR